MTIGETQCHRIGISGHCGIQCEVFLLGYCDEPDELVEAFLNSDASEKSKQEIKEYYDNLD